MGLTLWKGGKGEWVTEEGGGKVLPAETGRGACSAVANQKRATKRRKTCEKFKQMKTHLVF